MERPGVWRMVRAVMQCLFPSGFMVGVGQCGTLRCVCEAFMLSVLLLCYLSNQVTGAVSAGPR